MCIKYNLSNKMSPVQKAITLLNQPIAYALFQKKEFVFHASAIEIQDKAYIFMTIKLRKVIFLNESS